MSLPINKGDLDSFHIVSEKEGCLFQESDDFDSFIEVYINSPEDAIKQYPEVAKHLCECEKCEDLLAVMSHFRIPLWKIKVPSASD